MFQTSKPGYLSPAESKRFYDRFGSWQDSQARFIPKPDQSLDRPISTYVLDLKKNFTDGLTIFQKPMRFCGFRQGENQKNPELQPAVLMPSITSLARLINSSWLMR